MAFDPTRNALFLRHDEADSPLLKLDIPTGTLSEILVGFDEVSSLTLAPNGDHLLVGVRNELHRVDPDSGLSVLLSGPQMGSGPTLGYALAMVLDPRDPNRLYVLSSDYQIQIVLVDLRTGDRYLVSK